MNIMKRPALKAVMGNWGYYISTMTYRQLFDYVKMPKEVCDSKVLSERIQRELTDNVDKIAKYLKTENDRFFNALVLAVHGGKPSWYPGVFEKDDERFNNIGLLTFSGEEKIFPVDGQHRLAAIKQLVNEGITNNDEEVPVIFVAHQNSSEGNERTRRLFTSLNRYAQEVRLSDTIALDEDDIVYITTRYLVEKTDIFAKKVLERKTESMAQADDEFFTNIISLSKCTEYLLNPFMDVNEDKENYRRYRRNDEEIKDFEDYSIKFWKCFINKIPDIKEFFDGNYNKELRGDNGGNMLFRPRGLDPFIDAVTTICTNEDNVSYEEILDFFADYDFELTSKRWVNILWDGKIMAPGQQFMRDLFIYIYNPNYLTAKRRKGILTRYCEKKQISEDEAKIILSKGDMQ